jgi:hypothetical protein
MAKSIDVRAVSGVLYGVYKALHNLAGPSAPAIMRKAAPDILDELGRLGVDFSCVDDIGKLESKLGETMVDTGMCEKMQFRMEDGNLRANITNCSFYHLTSRLKEEGIPPFGCPFSALTIALAEKNLGKRARIKELQPTPGGNPGDTTMLIELLD